MTSTERRAAAAAPTLEEVAREAGVSRATASRAINGGSRVSPKAQAAVAAAVRTLGYRPNPAARSLVTRRTDSVAVVVPEPDERVFSDPFFSLTLRSVHRVLDEHGLQLVLLLARRGAAAEQTLRYLSGRPVDGALITSHHRDDGLAGRLADLGLPCVFGGRPWDHADRVSWVDVDQTAGGRLAAKALIERGRRVLATVAGPEDMTASVDRLTGWRAALEEAGVPSDRVAIGDFTESGGEAAARELLKRHPDLDGIFAASDLMAAGVLKVLTELGRRVPEDVAVVGFDDVGGAEHTTPALTTLRNPVAEMAEEATRMLLRQLSGDAPSTPVRLVMPTRLVRRDSC